VPRSIVLLSENSLSTHSLHSDPPIGTDVPTFTDLCLWIAHPSRRWSTLVGISRLWSSIPTEAKPAHLGRSSPTVVCLSWPTVVDLGPGWWRSKLGCQFTLVVLVITVSISWNSWHAILAYLSLMCAIIIRESSISFILSNPWLWSSLLRTCENGLKLVFGLRMRTNCAGY
jgi:hypothetical protein